MGQDFCSFDWIIYPTYIPAAKNKAVDRFTISLVVVLHLQDYEYDLSRTPRFLICFDWVNDLFPGRLHGRGK